MDTPTRILFRNATYVLAGDKKKKKEESSFSHVRIRGNGISFYINVLVQIPDHKMEDKERRIPFSKKVRSIPANVDLTADQLELALKAKKAGELWQILVEDVGWFWKGDDKSAKQVEEVQQVLDLLEKYENQARNPVIYAVVSNKIVGSW